MAGQDRWRVLPTHLLEKLESLIDEVEGVAAVGIDAVGRRREHHFDSYGRLAQMLGTNVPNALGGFDMPYMAPATEKPAVGATEVWQIANLSADTHPIHFHLVNVQIISRQAIGSYKVGAANVGVANVKGAPLPPAPFEQGWKETVRMNPGEVTTVIMKFDLPTVPFAVPPSPRTGGNEYVWHCHILEHEEQDMMRPLIVG